MLAFADPWSFQPHPEVWLTVVAVVALGVYAVRALAPVALPAGAEAVSRRQKWCFASGVALLWIAADWPMHDIAEDYLYSVHMVQHLLISFVVPPLLLLATPPWLARSLIVKGSFGARLVRLGTKPIIAGVCFNAVQALTHWGAVVELSSRNGSFHYLMHLLVFSTALMMWTPVLGPLEELQISEPAKMIYMFSMSILPTVPAAWLTFAEGSVYPVYDQPLRLWGISVTADQQAAGAVMKVLGGFFLWVLIAIRFFRYSAEQRRADAEARRRRHAAAVLTTADVQAEFERLGPPPLEPRL